MDRPYLAGVGSKGDRLSVPPTRGRRVRALSLNLALVVGLAVCAVALPALGASHPGNGRVFTGGANGGVMMLVRTTSVPSYTSDELTLNKADAEHLEIFGGTGAISQFTQDALTAIVAP